jgi:peptidyl-prolyl cis-trans isomerase A (cyclophilin A)
MATYAHFETTLGNFTVELFGDKTPNTVANFVGLADGTKEWTHPKTKEKHAKPYFDGIVFHRVINGFMIQGGDPLGQGYGGPGYQFGDEFHPDLRHHARPHAAPRPQALGLRRRHRRTRRGQEDRHHAGRSQ